MLTVESAFGFRAPEHDEIDLDSTNDLQRLERIAGREHMRADDRRGPASVRAPLIQEG
jgi:hypothetical protein